MAGNVGTIYIYRIDSENRFTYVSPEWQEFADANGCGESCSAEAIMGRELSDFIQDDETNHLYSILIERLREGHAPISFLYRCDSPDMRRRFEMSMEALSDGSIEFRSKVLSLEKRERVDMSVTPKDSCDSMIRMCSFCKRIALPEGWQEVEEAVRELGLFEKDKTPCITHTVCPKCLQNIMRELD